ncbi:MAG: hypothetical protein ACPGOY_16985 [Rhodospirillaceae bacterium]
MMAILALLLTACGAVPQPFKHETTGVANPLVALKAGPGVTIRPTQGLDVPWNRLIALELAESLRAMEIPAEAGANAPTLGYVLTTQAQLGPSDGIRRVVTVFWRLVSAEGQTINEGRADVPVPSEAWQTAAPEAAAMVASPPAQAVAAATALPTGLPTRVASRGPGGRAGPPQPVGVQPPPPVAAPSAPGPVAAAPPPPPSSPASAAPRAAPAATGPAPDSAESQTLAVYVKVERAPGDGVQALTDTLSTMLRQARATVVTDQSKATVSLIGTVDATPQGDGQDAVVIVWTVLDSDGTSLGKINQDNMVPSGSLNGPWGGVAPLVARGALVGLGQTLLGQGPP